MKQIWISILLISSIAGPLTFGLAAFELRFFQLKESFDARMNANLDSEKILTLSFTKLESETLLKWEHEREFEYQGEMYDVLEVTEKEGFIEYRVWHDTEESELKREEKKYEQEAAKAEQRENTHQSFHFIFYLERGEQIFFTFQKPKLSIQVPLNCRWENPLLTLGSPPPKQA